MKSEFDMAVFLNPVLKGAHATRQRHIRQAERMHESIGERWGCATPWSWREKHVRWFLEHSLRCAALRCTSDRLLLRINSRIDPP
jgi:hypothetical protein